LSIIGGTANPTRGKAAVAALARKNCLLFIGAVFCSPSRSFWYESIWHERLQVQSRQFTKLHRVIAN
jgi:hypothetical protein